MLIIFIVIASIALLIQVLRVIATLYGSQLRYKLSEPLPRDISSPRFLNILGALTDAPRRSVSEFKLLANGKNFYPAELEAIRAARQSVNIEMYIFSKGRVADEFLTALIERARAGVEVRVVLDAVGTLFTRKSYFDGLKAAGGRVHWYHPLQWPTFLRWNHRTHRELLIIDGEIGFIGGAGVADHWRYRQGKRDFWRDTMFRVEGTAVASLQTTFIENWLEASGEVISGSKFFPLPDDGGEEQGAPALVVNSTPSTGASTRARMLYGALLSAAHKSIWMNTPYFLPDDDACQLIIHAARSGAQVRIIVPGKGTDHAIVRQSSRRHYGRLMQAGCEIYEFEPAMNHRKILIVDSAWLVAGSTNFDHRSFGLNDEVNIAIYSPDLAEQVEQQFLGDMKDSTRVTYENWQRRPFMDRVVENVGRIVEQLQ